MTVLSAINNFRVWGVKGIIDFARRWPSLRRLKNSDKHSFSSPKRGITLIGPFSSHSGNSQTMRNFAAMLREVDIPFQAFDTNINPSLPPEDYRYLITPQREFDLCRYSHVIELFTPHAPRSPKRVHAVLAFWEYESGFDFAFPGTTLSRLPVVAMSDFNVRYFRSILASETPVFKIRHPLFFKTHVVTPPEDMRMRYNIPTDAFLVFFNFDYGSSCCRKNPEAVMRAFAKTFSSQDNAVLLLKTSNGKKHPRDAARLRLLSRDLALDSRRLIIVDGAVPQCDMSGFFNACDVYMSLHRGEGFGIGMAEAMYFGKPVIATGYSANTEFCTEENSFPVPFKLIEPQMNERDHPAYGKVESWAEPDIDSAAASLLRCFRDRDLANRIGAKASAFVHEYFSPENFKKDVDNFLDYGVPSEDTFGV